MLISAFIVHAMHLDVLNTKASLQMICIVVGDRPNSQTVYLLGHLNSTLSWKQIL